MATWAALEVRRILIRDVIFFVRDDSPTYAKNPSIFVGYCSVSIPISSL